MKICNNAELCIMGDFPTLEELKGEYNSMMPTVWLLPQLQSLSKFCGVKDKLDNKQLEQCAFIIATEYSYMKVSELMLFFYRFKSGQYGKFYGNVDPLVITTALRDFAADRNVEQYHYEEVRRKKELEEHMKHAVSHEEAMNTEEYKRGYQETL